MFNKILIANRGEIAVRIILSLIHIFMHGTVMAGQIAGMVKKEQTCKEMISEMTAEAEKLLSGTSFR